MIDHELQVPLDHAEPDGEQITVFAREVAEPDGRDEAVPRLPPGRAGLRGAAADRHPRGPGWLDRALKDFRVLMLDQRGTGPLDAGRRGRERGRATCGTSAPTRSCATPSCCARRWASSRWSVLGQSFGGFCVFSYLSLAPDGLREAFVTGGVPGIGVPVDEVYRATYERDDRAQPPLLRALPAATASGCCALVRAARRRGRAAARTATG